MKEPFMQKHLATQRFDTWQQAHRHMAEDQIRNPDFLVEWTEYLRKHPKSADKPAQERQPRQPNSGSAAAPEPAKTPPAQHSSDPLTYFNTFGVKNVNPHLIIDLDMNKERAQCDRCPPPTVHRWPNSMCTAYKGKKGDVILPRLSNEETKARKILKWNAGFFMTEDPTAPRPPHRQSPSVQDAAAAAAATNQALHN
jgi:hypothetical protein